MKNLFKEKLKNLTIAEFSEKAGIYDSNGMFEMVKEDYQDVVEEVEKEEFQSLADYGCGTGEFLNRLYLRHPDKQYTGIDITPEMLEVAKKKNTEICFQIGDSEECTLPEESIDIITCIHSFHHYPKPIRFLSNVYHSLKKGGRLILRDNSSKSFWKYLFMNYIRYPISHMRGKGDVHFYSIKEIEALCKSAGLQMEIIEVRRKNKLHCVMRKI